MGGLLVHPNKPAPFYEFELLPRVSSRPGQDEAGGGTVPSLFLHYKVGLVKVLLSSLLSFLSVCAFLVCLCFYLGLALAAILYPWFLPDHSSTEPFLPSTTWKLEHRHQTLVGV